MSAFDWFMTGRNNAFDRLFYGPPKGNGALCGSAYRIGWAIGCWGFPFNKRRKWRQ